MKRFNWWLIGLVAVCLSMIPLAGCMGVSQSKYEALQAEYEAVNQELTEIKEVYPPRDFESYSELSEWVSKHIKPQRSTADKW